ncbi:MAG TPA: GyrI-like domain-containing protein [Actinomycetales bacterium]
MDKVDLKAERKDLYAPPRGRFVEVVVPPMRFLTVDGHGDPNTNDDYADAVRSLFATSYAAKFLSKRVLGRDFVVLPLEGLWTADDLTAFERRAKGEWSWTMLIRQPDWIDAALVDRALDTVRTKGSLLRELELRTLDEGLCVQTLHVGSYDDEAPVLRALHHEHLPAHGLRPTGRHHEIYLSDPRRVAADRLRTVLRQPVERVDVGHDG